MKSFALATALASALALALPFALTSPVSAQPPTTTAVPASPAPSTDARDASALVSGLADLEKATFACPKAALNAAAREVATHKSIGTYQFSYFNIISASHHAAYEVHFTSNYSQEPVLKFCVALYCQQGFDPAAGVNVMPIAVGKAGGAASAGGAGRAGEAGKVMSGHSANPCAPPRRATRSGTTK